MDALNFATAAWDALSAALAPADSGAEHTHPVTRPDYVLTYQQKDITPAVDDQLISISYTDYLEGQSDELQVVFEDIKGRWLDSWYPDQGDKIGLKVGDQFSGLIDWGEFEIAEIEHQRRPDTITIKALKTGISKSYRTRLAKAYENTTLASVVRTVAKRLKLKVSGTIADIKIQRVTQYQERDVEFLARLAKEYGHSFKIVDKTLVFSANADLAKQEAVAIIDYADVISARLRDLIKGVPDSAEAAGYDPKTKQQHTVRRRHKPRRAGAKTASSADTLKIVANKGESREQMAARADAALARAAENQIAGTLTLVGNPKLVAGQCIRLVHYGKMSGRYIINQARHDYSRSGYTVDLEIKMVEYLPDDTPKQQPKSA